MSVIVTNARNRIAYNVVRSLGEKGIPVFAADFVPRSMSFASRYARGHFVYPSPFREPEQFLSCLLEHIDRFKARVLIPVFEETFLVSKYKLQLSAKVGLAVPDYPQVLLAHNKDQWEALARTLHVPVPRSYSIEALRGPVAAADIRFPILIKPKQGGGAWGIKQVDSAEALRDLLAQPEWASRPWERFFAQEKISGGTHCVAMLFSSGKLRATVGYRQLRDYPSTGGQATLRVSVRHEKAEEYLRRLLEALGWHGPCQADFIVDDKTGVPYLIDINPRLWGSLSQAIASGVDFPHMIYRLALDGDVAAVPSYNTGVVTRWIGGELAALPSRLRNSPGRLRLLQDFFFPPRSAALFDDLSLRDPLPFVVWTTDAIRRGVQFRSTAPVSHDALDGVWE